jgi:signal transduction histidine kinase
VRLALTRTPDSVVIQVGDNGPGIAPDEQSHIFQRFYRARHFAHANGDGTVLTAEHDLLSEAASPNGSGLGLAIAQAIVQAHHGVITFASVLGHGTTFTLRLPLAGPQSAGDEQTSPA